MPYVNSVFLSGTYKDLVEERKAAIEAFVNLGMLPITMEQFCADYHDKLEYIEKCICEADYFALIIGPTYGDYLDKDRKLSFTEWEYDVAIKNKKRILAFVCTDLAVRPVSVDFDKEKEQRLKDFTNKVKESPLVSFFRYGDIISLKLEMTKAFKNYGYHGKSPTKYYGVWISEIDKISSAENTYPRKSDKWTFYGKDGHVFGTIEREHPRKNKRNWSFTGIEFGDQLFVSFAELDVMQASAGIMIVQKVPNMDAWMLYCRAFIMNFLNLTLMESPCQFPLHCVAQKNRSKLVESA